MVIFNTNTWIRYIKFGSKIIMIKFCQTCKNNNYIDPGGANGYYWCWLDSVEVCEVCGTNFINIDFPAIDLKVIIQISQDLSFIESMIQLQQDNIIEYESRMSQFRTQVQQQENSRAQAANTVKCPRCGSTNITAGQRGFSLLTGFVGSGRTVNRCANCGHKWKP